MLTINYPPRNPIYRILRTWKPPRRLSCTVTLLLPYVLHIILVLSANIPPPSLDRLWTSSQTRYSAHRSPAHPSLSDHRTSTIPQAADDFSVPGTRSETTQRYIPRVNTQLWQTHWEQIC
ncbi:hypothetical protein FA15DRAFT_365752 [Coprinopsis marcescibilis]|uniref:Uncharacterized protein n=1 Tax=Coprinopsis marcescibilis TaxID=230819 RepID=A0A5C3KBN0_COPMA|nr:hypothetical protein FA15DRAFT_365752 [Coprinopsis marcescibilis]